MNIFVFRYKSMEAFVKPPIVLRKSSLRICVWIDFVSVLISCKFVQ